MKTLTINGEAVRLENVRTIADLLRELAYEGEFFAVAVNQVCVPRARYIETLLDERDRIEILSPMQGG